MSDPKPPQPSSGGFDPEKTTAFGEKTVVAPADSIIEKPIEPFEVEIEREPVELVGIDTIEDLEKWIRANIADGGLQARLANIVSGIKLGIPLMYSKMPLGYRLTFLRIARKSSKAGLIRGVPEGV